MPQDILIRILLLPVALLYGLAIGFRNLLYRFGVLRSVHFDIPVISIGNLSVGGTGKSPHVEYLIRWLDQYIEVSLLSRGYGRKTEGYRQVSVIDTALEVGDEPRQIKRKFPGVPISVSESRALGIPEMIKRNPEIQCVLLDDAYQHLAVRPGLNILLTEFAHPFTRDWLLPSGRLREWRYEYRRADIIVVTKCPPDLSVQQRRDMVAEIDPYLRQRIYFSRFRYGTPYEMLRPDQQMPLEPDATALLVSAIANSDYLMQYLSGRLKTIHAMEFEDHHYFSEADMNDIMRRFQALPDSNKFILTTEKDATRLELYRDFLWQHQITVYVLPVEVVFCDDDEAGFQADVRQFLMDFMR